MTAPINAYDPSIPQGDDVLSISQKNLLDNFQSLTQAFAVDHVSLINSVIGGNHNQAQLLVQSQSRASAENQMNIYTKLDENKAPQLFMRPIGNAPEIQYTQYQIYPVNNSSAFSTLPGDLLVDFGSIAFAAPSITIQLTAPVTQILGCWFMTDAGGITPNTQSNWFPQIIAANKINLFYKGNVDLEKGISAAPSQVFFLIISKLGVI